MTKESTYAIEAGGQARRNHRTCLSFNVRDAAGTLVATALYSRFTAGGTYLEVRELDGHLVEPFDPRRAGLRAAIESWLANNPNHIPA